MSSHTTSQLLPPLNLPSIMRSIYCRMSMPPGVRPPPMLHDVQPAAPCFCDCSRPHRRPLLLRCHRASSSCIVVLLFLLPRGFFRTFALILTSWLLSRLKHYSLPLAFYSFSSQRALCILHCIIPSVFPIVLLLSASCTIYEEYLTLPCIQLGNSTP